jgi:hypothetical protein
MNPSVVLDIVSLFFAGLLTGALFVIDYGVGRAPGAIPNEPTQIELRQALILSLRVLVPVIFVSTILLGVAATILDGVEPGFGFRCAGVIALLTSFLVALFGTARINAVALTWQPSAPPKNWRATIIRWQRLDAVRTWFAIAGYALLLTAVAVRLVAH